MSQIGQYLPGKVITTLTGDVGGAVSPTAGNIDILGAGFLTVTGNPGTSTLTISDDGTVATSFVTDAGTAIPALNVLNVLGGTNINTAGAGANLTVNLDDNITVNSMATDDVASGLLITSNIMGGYGTDANISIDLVPKGSGSVIIEDLSLGGSTITSSTNLTLTPTGDVIITSGTPYAPVYFGAANELTALGPLTNGQLMIGSNGAAPAAADLTSSDGTVVFTTGAGTLDLVVNDAIPNTFTTDAGSAVPVANNLNIVGGTGISTSGAGDTVTISGTGTTVYSYKNVNTTPYIVLDTDNILSVDCSGVAIDVLLPITPTTGQTFTIKDRTGSCAGNNITVSVLGGVVTVDGAVSFIMNVAYESVTVIFNGTNYEVL